MWFGAILQRQGWWTTEHATEKEANQWVNRRIIADQESVNPVLSFHVRKKPESYCEPVAPELTFDEWWPAT